MMGTLPDRGAVDLHAPDLPIRAGCSVRVFVLAPVRQSVPSAPVRQQGQPG